MIAAALALAACSGDRIFGDHQTLMGGDTTASIAPSTVETDAAPTATQREHQRILAAYGGGYEDTRLEAEVTSTVDRLVAASEHPDLTYKVTILNSPAVNAFALPTGQLYVTRGLLALANDNAELASVLSHEMAHVIAHHAAIREEEARQVSINSEVVNGVLSDPQDGALALARSKIKFASFSRSQEFEADGIGVAIAARAGFDPFGAARFLTSMGRNADLRAGGGGEARSPDFFSSHPATPERVKNAQTTARQHFAPGAGDRGGDRGRNSYLANLDGVVYGEDPIEGYVRGRRFLHPKLGFTFTAPEGFTLENTAQAVLGLKDGGNEALRLDAVKVPAQQSLAEYLGSGWIENVEPGSIEDVTLGGLPAATAAAKGDQWAFRLYVVRFNAEVYRFIFAAKTRTPEIEKAFRDSVATFRRLSATEAQQAKPLRLKIITVKAGDTVERLATRMALIDRQVERFRVLNGLEPGDRLKAGEQVKIVVE